MAGTFCNDQLSVMTADPGVTNLIISPDNFPPLREGNRMTRGSSRCASSRCAHLKSPIKFLGGECLRAGQRPGGGGLILGTDSQKLLFTSFFFALFWSHDLIFLHCSGRMIVFQSVCVAMSRAQSFFFKHAITLEKAIHVMYVYLNI